MKLQPEKRKAVRILVLVDYAAALLAWLLAWAVRQSAKFSLDFLDVFSGFLMRDVVIGFFLIPFIWLIIYLFSGTYFDLYRKSRLGEVNRTLISCLIGSVIIG